MISFARPETLLVARPRAGSKQSLFLAVALIMVGAVTPAQAEEGDFPNWTFGGYGTVGAVHSSERDADYTANGLNPGGAGHTYRISPVVDSRFGAQLGLALDAQWSATLQLVAERNVQKSFKPTVEWANIKYQLTPDFSIRLGRIALSNYLVGDYRKAGYALPWARPPVEVYGALPISVSDGIDLSYRWSAAGLNNVSQISYGRANVRVDSQDARAYARHLVGVSNTTTAGAWTVRANVMTADLTADLAKPLFNAFRQFGSQGAAIADTYGLDHKRVAVGNLGISYDPGNWFVMAETSRLNARSVIGDKTAYYATGGYRFGNLTSYLTYAKVKSNDPTRDDGLNLALVPAQAAPAAARLNDQLNGLLRRIAIQHTITTGLRWDFMPNRALKLQYDRLLPQGGSSGTLNNVQSGFVSGRPVHVVSIALDFVF